VAGGWLVSSGQVEGPSPAQSVVKLLIFSISRQSTMGKKTVFGA